MKSGKISFDGRLCISNVLVFASFCKESSESLRAMVLTESFGGGNEPLESFATASLSSFRAAIRAATASAAAILSFLL